MKNINIKDRRGGFYFPEGKPHLGVTTPLKSINKPAIQYWFGQQVYREMVVDPTISEREALSAPYAASERAKNRGSTIHSIMEAWKQTGVEIDPKLERFKPYVHAFRDWIEDQEIELISQEKKVFSEKYGIGGKYDIYCKKNGKYWLVDGKSGKDIYPEAWLQLSAYKEIFIENGMPVDEIAVLLLQKNGKYRFEKGVSDFQTYLAVKKLWEWQNQDLCQKVGYQSGQMSLIDPMRFTVQEVKHAAENANLKEEDWMSLEMSLKGFEEEHE
jgi:hypothetical protein